MESADSEVQSKGIAPSINYGHLGTIAVAIVLLLGASWMEKPQLFSFRKNSPVLADANVPHYYPYVAPVQDQPEVLGASTDPGPEIINDDGTVQPVDAGQVLGVSTQGVTLSLNDIKVNQVPDSNSAISQYFSDSEKIESAVAGDTDLASALNSGNQDQINQQAQKFQAVSAALVKLPVPQSLVNLQKLKIIQYNSAIVLLENFTQSDSNADLVTQNLQEFLKSQQDLDNENIAIAQKFGSLDPDNALYLNPDGTPAVSQSAIDNFGSNPLPQSALNNSDNIDPTTGLPNDGQ